MTTTETVEAARARYEKSVQKIADQHRYVARGQLETAGRAAILPDLEFEAAWNKGILDSKEGRAVDWTALKEQGRKARGEVERALDELREIRGY